MKSDTAFKLSLISYPLPIEEEVSVISRLLEEESLDCFHLRKPGYTLAEYESLLRQLPRQWFFKIRLHQYFELSRDYDIGGLHLNARHPLPPPDYTGSLSQSCHSVAEIGQWNLPRDFVFLSPVFPSISKPGYRTDFQEADFEKIRHLSGKIEVRALGGITPDTLPRLQAWGFQGAGILGHIWEDYRLHLSLDMALQRWRNFPEHLNAL